MSTTAGEDPGAKGLARHHLRLGWWTLTLFIGLGLTLESLLGLRVPWYVDATNETRRLMFRLGHAHGTLLAMVNVAFGLTLASSVAPASFPRWASRALTVATIAVPLGFLGGGVVFYESDPGLPIVLVPIGAVAALVATCVLALRLRR